MVNRLMTLHCRKRLRGWNIKQRSQKEVINYYSLPSNAFHPTQSLLSMSLLLCTLLKVRSATCSSTRVQGLAARRDKTTLILLFILVPRQQAKAKVAQPQREDDSQN